MRSHGDQVFVMPGTGCDPSVEFLNELQRMAVEDPPPPFAEAVLEQRRHQLVMSMTALRFVQLSPAEKRNYLRWADGFVRAFTEKRNLFQQHTPADIDLPAFLRRA